MENLNELLKKSPFTQLMLILFFSVCITFNGHSQDVEPIYTLVSFMKVDQSKTGKYLAVEQDLWKPVHQELVNQGKILGWYFYQIHYTGSGDAYNYATVTHYQGSKNLDAGYPDGLFEKVHPHMPDGYISNETLESRKIVTSRLLSWRLQSFPEEQRDPSRYAVVNYMKSPPGMAGDFFSLRRDYVMPAFNQAVKDGKVEGWGLWSTVFPSGADMPYNHVTGDFYNEFDQIGNNSMGTYIEKANPGKNLDEIWQKLDETRKMVKRELWELIDYVR